MLARRIAHFVAAGAIASSLFLALPSSAAASCVPNRQSDGHYHFTYAYQYPGPTVNGVSSNILNYQPYVPSGHFSYSWVMITNSASNIYAQIGNYEHVGGREVHVQYNDGGGIHDFSWGPRPLGQYTNYKITYSGGLFYFYADSYVFSHYASWIPTAGEFASEITSLNVQMMGATYSGVWFASNQLLYNGSWHYLAGTLFGNSTDFGISGDSSSFVTWDRACSY